jgi:2-polyprenyl-3-methyl-5-hydroxy-6-metoxy-1,4-benzoquinol methylase
MAVRSVTNYFDRIAPSWDEHYARSRLFRARYRAFQRAVSRHGSGVRRALDYGCGSGVLVEILAKAFESVVATDLSERMLDITRRKYAGFPHVAVSKPDQLSQSSFDLIICSSVVEYVEDPDTLVGVLLAYMCPGGLLLMTFSNCLGPLQLFGRHLLFRFKRDSHTNFARNFHSRRSILDLIQRHSLECLELGTPIGLPVFRALGLGELHFLVARKKA